MLYPAELRAQMGASLPCFTAKERGGRGVDRESRRREPCDVAEAPKRVDAGTREAIRRRNDATI